MGRKTAQQDFSRRSPADITNCSSPTGARMAYHTSRLYGKFAHDTRLTVGDRRLL
ncbi:MAG: hypothetical protein AAFY30_00070 [Cyanobacteria bacterium J06642_12]